MKNIIITWTAEDPENFEKRIPLKWSGERNIKLGSKNNFYVFFLEGYDLLSEKYKEELKNLNYKLFDCSKIFVKHSKKYTELDRFSDYDKKCFLRWLVLDDILGDEQFIHYDGDIIFNETPENIEHQLGDLTFTFQGCPAMVSTGKKGWLEEYKKNFLEFIKNIDNYSKNAWKERSGWQESFEKKWAGLRFRKIISSDQDFISHLIHTDRLPQDNPKTIKSKLDLFFFINPLYFFEHNKELEPFYYERRKGIDYFNSKKVAFWHMQNDCVNYLFLYIRRGLLNKISRCKNILEKKFIEYNFWETIDNLSNGRLKMQRLDVYKYFFEKNDFVGLFNDKTFWKKNLFIKIA